MKKVLKTTAVVLGLIILTIGLFLGFFTLYDRVKYKDFYAVATAEFAIPALGEGYIPQGFDYNAENDVFLACGYMNNKSASRVYVIDRDGKSYCTLLKKANGSAYTGHAGGVTYFGDYLYIASSKGLDVFSLNDILNKDVESATQLGTVSTFGIGNAYCTAVSDGAGGGYIYVGCFHREKSHPTDKKLHLTTPNGDDNRAMMLKLPLSSTAQFGVDNTQIISAYSIPSYVQGVEQAGDRIVLSTSYGFATSIMYSYNETEVTAVSNADYCQTTFGVSAPLYYLDGASLSETYYAPAMAEEIVYLDGKLYIMNESACNKYLFGKITSGNTVHSIKI